MQVTSSKKEIWTVGSYSLLTLSIMVGFMYLNTFATEVLLIPAETLAIALLAAKTIDFCVSLFAGMIIEKVKISSKGKNQSWLYLGRWILAITILLEVCNTTAAPMVVRIAVLSVSYTILNCLMNVIQTAPPFPPWLPFCPSAAGTISWLPWCSCCPCPGHWDGLLSWPMARICR